MAQITVAPFVVRNVLLTLGTDDYRHSVSTVQFNPSAPTASFKGLGGVSTKFVGISEWTCDLEYAQDWATVNSLARYLLANEGSNVAAIFQPVAGGPGFTATLSITPGSIGGAVDATATAKVTLGSTKPIYVPAA